MTLLRARILTLGLLSGACTVPVEGSDATARSRAAILGGQASGEEDDAVVQIFTAFGPPCTGALIAPNVVATALHCVADFDPSLPYTCTSEGKLATPDFGGGWVGEPYQPFDIYVSGGAGVESDPALATEVISTGSATVCRDDIAFVILNDDMPFPWLPIRLHRPVKEGEKVTVVGYSGSTEIPEIRRARRSGVEVLAVGPDDTTAGYGTVAPRAFVVDEGLCAGDEGAPAISEQTGALIGTFSRFLSGNACEVGATHQFTKLAPYVDLVERAFEIAGRDPNVEPSAPSPPPRGTDGSCTVAETGTPPASALPWWAVALGLLGARVTRSRQRRALRAHGR
jgi:hypothetical protein